MSGAEEPARPDREPSPVLGQPHALVPLVNAPASEELLALRPPVPRVRFCWLGRDAGECEYERGAVRRGDDQLAAARVQACVVDARLGEGNARWLALKHPEAVRHAV